MKKFRLLFLALLFSISMNAQLLDFIKDKVKDKLTNVVGTKVNNLITTEAISTNFKDCDIQHIKNPQTYSNEVYKSLCSADFTDKGYLLTPGFYEIELKSFCLHAGTYAPSKGDGYLYAPLRGSKQEIIMKIVKNWYQHPEIEQQYVQYLIWAILSKTNFKNLGSELLLVAHKLLSEKDILALSNWGLDFIPSNIIEDVKSKLPRPIQLTLDAENKIRGFFSSHSSSYSELENYAILAGFSKEKSLIDYGTWGLHPLGFWISYQPQGYTHIKIRIYVPDSVTSVYYIPSNDVAVPANTGSQRLMISDVKNCN